MRSRRRFLLRCEPELCGEFLWGSVKNMERTQDFLYIVLPAYNEQENIEAVVAQWYPIVEAVGPESRLVIVDDGSRDKTYALLCRCAQSRPQLIALTKPNSGHGATVLFAYHYALDHGAGYVFQTDSDGQTLPEEFWPFWEQRHSYDLIIGDRRARQDGISRIVVTKTLKAVVRICFRVSVPDANTPFRLMEASVLREDLALIPPDFNLSNVVLCVIYFRKHQRVKYLPITFRPRQGGVNSLNLPKIIRIGKQSLRDFRAIDHTLREQGV